MLILRLFVTTILIYISFMPVKADSVDIDLMAFGSMPAKFVKPYKVKAISTNTNKPYNIDDIYLSDLDKPDYEDITIVPMRTNGNLKHALVFVSSHFAIEDELFDMDIFNPNNLTWVRRMVRAAEEAQLIEAENQYNVENISNVNDVTSNPQSHIKNDMEAEEPNQYVVVLGNPNSKVVIEEYTSPSCYMCKLYQEEIFPKIRNQFLVSAQVRYRIVEIIQGAQDFHAVVLMKTALHKYGNNREGIEMYFKLKEAILSKQPLWLSTKNFKEILASIGEKFGISKQEYFEALKNNDIAYEIAVVNIDKMRKNRIKYTPAILVNGIVVDEDKLEAEIQRNLDIIKFKEG